VQPTSSLQGLKPDKALTLLNLIKPNEPDWFWKRLSLLAQNLVSQEILTFSTHPDCAFLINGSYLAGKLSSGHVLIYPSAPLEKIDLSELKKRYERWFHLKNTNL